MKTLVILDPGMDAPVGHHLSVSTELARSTRELGFDCWFVASTACNPLDFAGLRVLPTFSIGPYLSHANADEDLARCLAAQNELSDEYASTYIPDGACVLMHTASPWHLRALADRLVSARDVRVAIGLMLPPTFWTRDQRLIQLLDSMTQQALEKLRQHYCCVYSETSQLCGHGTLLPPLSRQTLYEIACAEKSLVRRRDAPLRMGYFGQPRAQKGFYRLLAALSEGVPGADSGIEIEFFLPPGYLDAADQVNSCGTPARASSVHRHPRRYLDDMMSVDVVLCAYDPAFYESQMSGIVAEAVMLGKATLVSKGTSLQSFLDRFAPGSYCAIDFEEDALIGALRQGPQTWRRPQVAALASRSLVRELKRADRFFSIAFGLGA